MDTNILVGKKLRNFAVVNWFLLIAWLVDFKFDQIKIQGQGIDQVIGNMPAFIVVCILGYIYLFIRFWFNYKENGRKYLLDRNTAKGYNYIQEILTLIKKHYNRRYAKISLSKQSPNDRYFEKISITNPITISHKAIGLHLTYGERKDSGSGVYKTESKKLKPGLIKYVYWHTGAMLRVAKFNNDIADYMITFILLYINLALYSVVVIKLLICY